MVGVRKTYVDRQSSSPAARDKTCTCNLIIKAKFMTKKSMWKVFTHKLDYSARNLKVAYQCFLAIQKEHISVTNLFDRF
jgi:hypothetical protein